LISHGAPFPGARVTLQMVGGFEPVPTVTVPCAADVDEKSTAYVHVAARAAVESSSLAKAADETLFRRSGAVYP